MLPFLLQVICHLPYTRKIDVYSYGIVLWELCTSLVPYEGMSFVQLAHAVANDVRISSLFLRFDVAAVK